MLWYFYSLGNVWWFEENTFQNIHIQIYICLHFKTLDIIDTFLDNVLVSPFNIIWWTLVLELTVYLQNTKKTMSGYFTNHLIITVFICQIENCNLLPSDCDIILKQISQMIFYYYTVHNVLLSHFCALTVRSLCVHLRSPHRSFQNERIGLVSHNKMRKKPERNGGRKIILHIKHHYTPANEV